MKKFLNVLPVFGILALLLACPAGGAVDAEDNLSADDPTGKKLIDLEKGIKDLETGAKKLWGKDEVLEAIQNRGVIDHKDATAVFAKVVGIMKAGQGSGTLDCNFFYPGNYLNPDGRGSGVASTVMIAYEKSGATGGTFSIERFSTGSTTNNGVKPAAFSENGHVAYTYTGYSIDGIYELDGKFVLKGLKKADGNALLAVYVANKPFFGAVTAGDTLSTNGTSELTLKAVKHGLADNDGFPEDGIKIVFEKGVGVTMDTTQTKCPTTVATNGAEVQMSGTKNADGTPGDPIKKKFGPKSVLYDYLVGAK